MLTFCKAGRLAPPGAVSKGKAQIFPLNMSSNYPSGCGEDKAKQGLFAAATLGKQLNPAIGARHTALIAFLALSAYLGV